MAAALGAYGYGLQGWDVSFLFQNGDSGGFSDRLGRSQWDATAPQILGLFPAVARQVLRGDVREADLLAPLYVHVPSLGEGRLGFTDRTVQQYDVKSFDTDKVPARALAVARCAVAFPDEYRDTPAFDLGPFQKDGFLISSTGQLRWKEAGDTKLGGWFTIDTPGTKAVVGFAAGQVCRLGEVTITPQSPFAAIYVTAREPDKDLRTSKKLLLTALARARNTGMQFNDAGNGLLNRGQAPILLESVKATIMIQKPGTPQLVPLDHDGLRTARTLPIQNGSFTIDSARDQTPYYLIEF